MPNTILDLPTRLPPPTSVTATSMALASAILAGVSGYFLGQASSLGLFSRIFSTRLRNQHPPSATKSRISSSSREGETNFSNSGSESEFEDDDSDIQLDSELNDFKDKRRDDYKLVLIVRTDLGMSRGKIAAQCSHATLACYKTLLHSSPATKRVLNYWERRAQAKVALQVKSEEELLMLQARARSLGLCAQVVRDAGRTQIAAGSITVLGIGPGPKGVVDSVTGHLKLL